MTEIVGKKIEIRKGVVKWCAADNHNHKNRVTYDIIFKADTPKELYDYLVLKGVICQ